MRLTLLGAGPGDPELISVKGVKALLNADVVLYDALVHPDLLAYVKPTAEKIYVGKRACKHSFKQEDINDMIVKYAKEKGHVVRLKGGDPFVFGRGHEELEFAKMHNIEVEVIPGITSPTSIPALQGVPLTRRGINESFWVVTGSTKDEQLSKDLALASQTSATIVVLMGLNKLPKIAETFIGIGKADTPIMIVQNGSLKEEKIALGIIQDIEEIVRRKEISTPALIVIGEVVSLHPEYIVEYVTHNIINES